MSALTPLAEIHGELLALRIVVQRLLGQMAVDRGYDVRTVIRAEHEQASSSLSQSRIVSRDRSSDVAALAHAQSVLDDIYGIADGTMVE